ncbi:MAG: PIN domain-containing protein [Actinomycetia bacterium]|nr:PIN domain-containing protein [Actinomycetes bacterium]
MTNPRRLALDTSVAVPLLTRAHPAAAQVSDWASGKELYLAGHAAVETYSVLTRLPGAMAVTGEQAGRLIAESFVGVLPLPERLAGDVAAELARAGVLGGAAYDGLVALAAKAHDAVLATRDRRAGATYEAIGVPVVLVRISQPTQPPQPVQPDRPAGPTG